MIKILTKKSLLTLLITLLLISGISVNTINAQFTVTQLGVASGYSVSDGDTLYPKNKSLANYPQNKLASIYDKYDLIFIDTASSKTSNCNLGNVDVGDLFPSTCKVTYKGISYGSQSFDLVITHSGNENIRGAWRSQGGHSGYVFNNNNANSSKPKTDVTYKLYYAGTTTDASDEYPFMISIFDPDFAYIKPEDTSEWYWIDNTREKEVVRPYITYSFEDTMVFIDGIFKTQHYKINDYWQTVDVEDPADWLNGDVLIFKGNQTIHIEGGDPNNSGVWGMGTTDMYYILMDKQTQKARIRYYDNTSGTEVLLEEKWVTGAPNSTINYSTTATINKYKNQGYILINDGFPTGATFDNDSTKDQVYDVVLSKQGTAKVLYIDQDQNNVVLEEKTGISGMHDTSIAAAYSQRMNDTQYWIDRGYTVVVDEFNTKNPKFIAGQLQVVNIYLKHTYTTVSKETYEKDKCLNKSCTVKQPEKGC